MSVIRATLFGPSWSRTQTPGKAWSWPYTKDPVSGSLFAVDASFVDQVSVFLPGIYNSGTLQLDEDDELDGDNVGRRLPVSEWPT